MNHSPEKLREDYFRWHPAQVATDDIDPVYPVLRTVADLSAFDDERRAWMVFCHVVYYYPGSTFAAQRRMPYLDDMPDSADGLAEAGLLSLPTGTERRGHRPKQPLIDHLLGLRESMPDGAWAWAQAAAVGSTPEERWTALSEALVGLRGNGRWAAYKTAEMLQKVCGLSVAAPDAGHRHSSGPRKGLELLEPHCPTGNTARDIEELDALTELWADVLQEADIAQVETSLCDFNSLVRGRYYLGHDIDSMLEAFRNPRVASAVPTEAWEARSEVFGSRFLGEHKDWDGVRRELKNVYKTQGVMVHV